MHNEPSPLFPTVLLIEDEPAHALLIRRHLKPFVGRVEHVDRFGRTAEAAAATPPDLIITDLNLPDCTGLAHVGQLIEMFPTLPVVVLSSSTNLKEAVEAMRLGARDYLVKNFDNQFGEVLGLALRRVRAAIAAEAEQARLRREIEVLRVAIANSPDGLAVFRGEGVVGYRNRAFELFAEETGGNVEAIATLIGDAVVKEDQLRKDLTERYTSMSTGSSWATQVLFKERKDRAHELTLSVLTEDDADVGMRVGVLWVRDSSEQMRREKFQREILATTTHDLKGPLGAITLSAEMAFEMAPIEGRLRDILVRISSSARSATNLIEEFLSARRIQEGSFILRPQPCDVGELAREVLEDYVTIAKSRSIEIRLDAGENLPAVMVDRSGFGRVLSNLLSNATKFTRKGGTIDVRLRSGGEELLLEVQDSGTGMEPAEVQRIFDRFSRLDKHQDVAGSGLGLFVVKSIVAAHGGRIDVWTKLGEGTKFTLVFPQRPPMNERGELIALDFA